MTDRNKRSVSNFLVLPKFQLRYILINFVSSLILSASLCLVFYYFSKSNYDILVDLSPMTDEARALVYYDLKRTIVTMAALSLLFSFVISVVAAVHSHRSAGPVYKVMMSLRDITEQKYEKFYLRPKDEFQEIVPLMNLVIEKLEKS